MRVLPRIIRGGLFAYAAGFFLLTTIYLLLKCRDLDARISQTSSHPEAEGRKNAQGFPDEAMLQQTHLAVIILTSPKDAILRRTIRQTWLRLSSKGATIIRHFFPLGTKKLAANELSLLRDEENTEGDLMILPELGESYDRLTAKVLAVLTELRRSLRFDFVLKVDGDSFVRLGALLRALQDIAHPRLYWGFLDGRASPKATGRWAERDWKLCDRYLPYACGGGYVLSWQLADFLTRNGRLFKQFHNEDVSVGAWLAGLDVRYVHDPRFDTEYVSRGCVNSYLVTHKQTEAQLVAKFELVKSAGRLCESEYRSRGSYVYDWSTPPSKCCQRTNDTRIP